MTEVKPVLDALAGLGVPLSLDTQKPELMREAVNKNCNAQSKWSSQRSVF